MLQLLSRTNRARHTDCDFVGQSVLGAETLPPLVVRPVVTEVETVGQQQPPILRDDAVNGLAARLQASAADEQHPVRCMNLAERPLTKAAVHREVDTHDDRNAAEPRQPAGNRIDVLLVAVDDVDPMAADDASKAPERSCERPQPRLAGKRQIESIERAAFALDPFLKLAQRSATRRRDEGRAASGSGAIPASRPSCSPARRCWSGREH